MKGDDQGGWPAACRHGVRACRAIRAGPGSPRSTEPQQVAWLSRLRGEVRQVTVVHPDRVGHGQHLQSKGQPIVTVHVRVPGGSMLGEPHVVHLGANAGPDLLLRPQANLELSPGKPVSIDGGTRVLFGEQLDQRVDVVGVERGSEHLRQLEPLGQVAARVVRQFGRRQRE